MSRLRVDDIPTNCEEWLKRCAGCRHCFMRGGKDPHSTGHVYCLLKECRFEPIKEKKKTERTVNGNVKN